MRRWGCVGRLYVPGTDMEHVWWARGVALCPSTSEGSIGSLSTLALVLQTHRV